MAVRSFVKIDLNNHQDVFLSCNYKPGEKLFVTLLDLNENKAFTGCARDIDLRSQAATINMTFSDFLCLTKNALLQNEPGSKQFLYCLEKNCRDILFQWKSVDHEETVVDIGSIKVAESDYGLTIKNIFVVLSEELLTLNKNVLNMEAELLQAKKEKTDALQLVSKATDLKECVETELFSKFILVLNEKKRKIKELKQNNKFKLESNTKKKRTKATHQISESSDDATSDVEKKDMAVPSTSKNNSFLFFSDEESDLLQVSPSKRRVRNKASVNKNLNINEQKSTSRDISMESESEDDLFKNL